MAIIYAIYLVYKYFVLKLELLGGLLQLMSGQARFQWYFYKL